MKASESNLDSRYHMSDIADKELYEITKKVKKYDDSKGIVTKFVVNTVKKKIMKWFLKI